MQLSLRGKLTTGYKMETEDKQVSEQTKGQASQPSDETIREVAAQLRRIGDEVNQEFAGTTVNKSDVLVWMGMLAAVPILGAIKS